MFLGLRIVSNSIRQILGNANAVLRIFMLPVMLTILMMDRLQLYCLFSEPATDKAIRGGYFPWGSTALLFLTVQLFFLRCAVAWHRFILLDEAPGFPRTPLRVKRIWAYFQRSVWLVLLAMPLLLALGLAAIVLAAIAIHFLHPDLNAEPNGGWLLLASILMIPCYALSWRLASSLPSAALGNSVSVRQVWTGTKSQFWTFFVVTCFFLAFSLGTSKLMSLAGVGTETPAGGAIRVTVAAVRMILTLSILTTLYGYYIEKRPLT